MISGLAAMCVVASWPANPRTAPFTPESTKASVAALQLGGFAGTPPRAAGAKAYGHACGTREEGLREGVGLLRKLRIGGGAGRGAPVVRDGAEHALRQRGELAGLRHRDPDRRLGNEVVPGDQRGDARERRGVARPVEERRGGRAVACDGRREGREGRGLRVLHEDAVERVAPAVSDAARRRPRRRRRTASRPSRSGTRGCSRSRRCARRWYRGARRSPTAGLSPTPASTSAAFEHACFNASV